MLETLKDLDTRILLLLNGLHSTPTDYLMLFFSNRPVWIPLYLFLIFLLYKQYGRKFWIPLTGAIVMILLVDQGTVHLFKNVFLRLRPCHEPALEGKLHLLDGVCSGQYGFISSHAANTFALAVYLFGFLRGQRKWLAISLLVWAGIVSYSRIYLGVHYPGDVICGTIFGASLGYLLRLTVKRFGQLGPEQVL